LFGVLFDLFFVLLVFDQYHLDVSLFEKIQDLQEEDFEQQQLGDQGKCSLSYPICFLPIVTHLHALIWITYTLYNYRIEIMVSRFA
jgi:hypothetical protein